jgi:hypothetical protein
MWCSSANARDAYAGAGPDAEVVHPASAAEVHLAVGVEPVVTDAVMGW